MTRGGGGCIIFVGVCMKKYPDLCGKTVLVTGATDGIGKELSRMFAHTGATLILHGRNPERLATTLKEITEESGNSAIQTVRADFASLSQVKAMADEIKQKVQHLDILVNNAGLYPKCKVITEDGFEQTLQVNYISPVTLTLSLIPLLGGECPSKIVNLTSIGHRFVWSNIRDPQDRFLGLGVILPLQTAHDPFHERIGKPSCRNKGDRQLYSSWYYPHQTDPVLPVSWGFGASRCQHGVQPGNQPGIRWGHGKIF